MSLGTWEAFLKRRHYAKKQFIHIATSVHSLVFIAFSYAGFGHRGENENAETVAKGIRDSLDYEVGILPELLCTT